MYSQFDNAILHAKAPRPTLNLIPTGVGINAEGHYVLDLNGTYAAYPKEKLEEVIPYTIGIR